MSPTLRGFRGHQVPSDAHFHNHPFLEQNPGTSCTGA